jgi:peptidoglycan/LPS O-acetylase OafA/YrhL
LRGISSVFVLVFHCAVWLPAALPDSYRALPPVLLAFWRQTWFGVDVFFVLSGFLIGRILMRRLQQGALGFRAFYVRRSFRIFPVYYVVLTASVFAFSRVEAWGVLFGHQTVAETLRGSWANYLYVSNYVYGMQYPNAMSWGWSLCVEEHFYLVLPAALAVLFKLTRGNVRPLVLLALAAVPTLCRWSEFSHHREISVFNWIHPRTHTHADGLVLGLLIAYTYVFHRQRASAWVARLGPATWILGVACIASVMRWGGLRAPGLFPVVWQYLVVAVGASLLVLNGLYLDNPFSRFISHRVWIPLARASYCTYLIQMFVIYWVLGWWPRGQYATTGAVVSAAGFSAVVLGVSFLIAGSTYLALERPMLERGARLAARYLVPAREPDRAK